jgi:isopentenyl-diphosphate delta-isomerase type 1
LHSNFKVSTTHFISIDYMELVVLVDENNTPIGTFPKATVHTSKTPLHRGFSLFLFNRKGELLLTRRALSKKTFPGVWTNTVCGHPAPGEDVVSSAVRRLKDEMGISGVKPKVISDYRYTFADSGGIVENEICPVLIALADANPHPVPDEIEEWKWVAWDSVRADMKNNPTKYSPWSREEAVLIDSVLNLHR